MKNFVSVVLCLFFVLITCDSLTIGANELHSNWEATFGGVSQTGRFGNTRYCPSNTKCVPITSCPILNNLINRGCVYNNRLGELGCGYQGSDLVCCPVQSRSFDTDYTQGTCGLPLVQGQNYRGIGAFPWVARIGFKNFVTGELRYPCSGSILSTRVILTAAHCALAKSQNFKLYNIRVGEWSTNSDIDCGNDFCALPVQDITISHVILHPEYEEQIYKNDIALIVLGSNINYSVTAQPICLPDLRYTTSGQGILVGWGKTAGQIAASSHQQVLHLPIINLQQCANIYATTLPITENHLCVGGESGNDACSGFGGSPLIQRDSNNYYQIGILSFGSDRCGAPNVPSVYVNIKKYINWIKENMPTFYNK